MVETEGAPLATIGEIARQHGDIPVLAVRGEEAGLFGAVLGELRDDLAHLAGERPYSAVFAALAVGFFGGLSIALSRRGRRYSRGW